MKAKNKIKVSSAFLGIAALGVLWRLIFIFRDMPRLINFPLIDDTFYSLGIAKNLAMGLGFTHDGVIQTNGFQPLFVFLSAPLYSIFKTDIVTPVYIVLFAQTILGTFTGYIIYRLTKKTMGERSAILAAFLWFVPVTMFKFDINGLETGLYVFFIMLSVAVYIEKIRLFQKLELKYSIFFGLVLALAVLSRNDGFFLVIALVLDFLLLHRSKLREREFLTDVIKHMGICVAVFVLVIFPWFYFNAVEFGSIIPKSGHAVRVLSQKFIFDRNYFDSPVLYCLSNVIYSFKKLINQHPVFEAIIWLGTYLGCFKLFSSLVIAVIGCTGLFLFFDRKNFGVFYRNNNLASFRFAWIYGAVMICAYSFFVFGQHHFPRYYFPLEVVFLFVTVAVAKYLFSRFTPMLKRFAYLFVVMYVLVVNLGNLEIYKFWGHYQELATFYQTSACQKKHFKKGDIIGAFQSGALGYFSKNRVINLDGVVNIKANQSIENGTMLEYIKSHKINYLVDVYAQYRALLGMSPDEMLLDRENFEPINDCYIEGEYIRVFRVLYDR